MARLIQDRSATLAEELLFGKLAHGGEVNVTVKEGENGKSELTFLLLVPAAPKLDAKKAPKGKKKSNAQSETGGETGNETGTESE
jgi:ATP-dependent Clp protease ATP-binding subunit ClpA